MPGHGPLRTVGEPALSEGGRLRTDSVDMSTTMAGVTFPAPVFTASGCAAAGAELAPFLDVAALGGIVTKSVMNDPRSGRATPRMAETPSGMLNSIGLQGPGIEAFLAKDLPWLNQQRARAVVSIAGGSVAEYVSLAQKLRGRRGISMIEVNISCPNVEDRGQVFACDPTAAAAVIAAVKRVADVPILAKLSPDVTSIVEIAGAVLAAGAHGLAMINTLLGIDIDTTTMRPTLGGITGGLSGPAIRPVAVRCVWQVAGAMRAGDIPTAPILGMGGIRTGLDALQFVLAGASAVSVGTATFGDPGAPMRVQRELATALAERGFARLADAVGLAHNPWPLPPEVEANEADVALGAQGDALETPPLPPPPTRAAQPVREQFRRPAVAGSALAALASRTQEQR